MLLDQREELLRPRRSRDGWAGPPGTCESASGSQGHIVDPKLRFSGSGRWVKENSPVLRPGRRGGKWEVAARRRKR